MVLVLALILGGLQPFGDIRHRTAGRSRWYERPIADPQDNLRLLRLGPRITDQPCIGGFQRLGQWAHRENGYTSCSRAGQWKRSIRSSATGSTLTISCSGPRRLLRTAWLTCQAQRTDRSAPARVAELRATVPHGQITRPTVGSLGRQLLACACSWVSWYPRRGGHAGDRQDRHVRTRQI